MIHPLPSAQAVKDAAVKIAENRSRTERKRADERSDVNAAVIHDRCADVADRIAEQIKRLPIAPDRDEKIRKAVMAINRAKSHLFNNCAPDVNRCLNEALTELTGGQKP